MSLLGNEKASQKRFKITGKFTGGVGSSGKWNPVSQTAAGANRFGNDWEAEARYRAHGSSQPSLGERLRSAQQKDGLGAAPPQGTVQAPASAKSKAVSAVKEAARNKATSLLSPRAQAESTRLENLFTR